MKRRYFCVIVSIIILSYINLAEVITNPEQIGIQAFNILKNFERNGKSIFLKNFITIEEIKTLAKNETVIKSEISRKKMIAMKDKYWNDRILSRFERLKKNGEKFNIKWADIEYSDFLYCIKYEDGIRGCKGDLYFKYKEQSFEINISYVFDGKEFKLVNIEGLSEI